MAEKGRTCLICGKKYKFCRSCTGKQPAWKTLFDSDNCYAIYDAISNVKIDKLKSLDLSEATEEVKAQVSEMIAQREPKVEKTEKAVEKTQETEKTATSVEKPVDKSAVANKRKFNNHRGD